MTQFHAHHYKSLRGELSFVYWQFYLQAQSILPSSPYFRMVLSSEHLDCAQTFWICGIRTTTFSAQYQLYSHVRFAMAVLKTNCASPTSSQIIIFANGDFRLIQIFIAPAIVIRYLHETGPWLNKGVPSKTVGLFYRPTSLESTRDNLTVQELRARTRFSILS